MATKETEEKGIRVDPTFYAKLSNGHLNAKDWAGCGALAVLLYWWLCDKVTEVVDEGGVNIGVVMFGRPVAFSTIANDKNLKSTWRAVQRNMEHLTDRGFIRRKRHLTTQGYSYEVVGCAAAERRQPDGTIKGKNGKTYTDKGTQQPKTGINCPQCGNSFLSYDEFEQHPCWNPTANSFSVEGAKSVDPPATAPHSPPAPPVTAPALNDIREWSETFSGVSGERLRNCIIYQLDHAKNDWYRKTGITIASMGRENFVKKLDAETPVGWTPACGDDKPVRVETPEEKSRREYSERIQMMRAWECSRCHQNGIDCRCLDENGDYLINAVIHEFCNPAEPVPERALTCQFCPDTFKNQSSLADHVFRVHRNPCSRCKTVFPTKSKADACMTKHEDDDVALKAKKEEERRAKLTREEQEKEDRFNWESDRKWAQLHKWSSFGTWNGEDTYLTPSSISTLQGGYDGLDELSYST